VPFFRHIADPNYFIVDPAFLQILIQSQVGNKHYKELRNLKSQGMRFNYSPPDLEEDSSRARKAASANSASVVDPE
jgi:hypothetical protein